MNDEAARRFPMRAGHRRLARQNAQLEQPALGWGRTCTRPKLTDLDIDDESFGCPMRPITLMDDEPQALPLRFFGRCGERRRKPPGAASIAARHSLEPAGR